MKRIFLVLFAIVVSLLIVELILAWISPRSPIFDPRLALYPYFRIERHPTIRGLASPAFYTTNAWGLRGTDPPLPFRNAYSIITVGGSTTMCALNDDERTWPAVMERELKSSDLFDRPVWVANAGVDGQTSWGHRVVMERVIGTIKPDCALLMVGLNDASLCLAGRETAGPADEWLVLDPRKSGKSKLFWNSRLLQFLWLEDRLRSRRVVPGAYAHRQIKFETATVQQGAPVDTATPDSDLLRILGLPDTIAHPYAANLREIIRAGRAMPVRMVLVSQPVLYGHGACDYDGALLDIEADGAIRWLADPQRVFRIRDLEALMMYFNRVTERVAREEGVEFFDLAARIPRRQEYFYDGIHFTDAGSELIGRTVAEYFASRDARK
ncbi:MAG: GDSL-type esterase/lipase family protein [Candidatus Hydrogenedentota bacterium]